MIDNDDRLNQTCTKCGVGDYQETSIHDDWEGVLHCTNKKCNHEVKRYKHKDNPQPTQQMTFDRAQLIEDYIQQLLECMDYKTMESIVYDTIQDNLSDYTDEQLITEIKEYNPELLEDVPVEEVAHYISKPPQSVL
jgi:predicted RNA-binding protein Jag